MRVCFQPLFFSGGTALKELAVEMAARGVLSTHIVTTYDSGGSTAQLRKSFAMPAVGDLRNRLAALANRKRVGKAPLELINFRFPIKISRIEAQERLTQLVYGREAWRAIPAEFADLFRHSLYIFRERMPGSFDARGANMGNLMLTGSFLENGRDLLATISLFAAVLKVQGTISPISEANLHLGARLRDGQIIIGQEKFHQLPARIEDIFLTVNESQDAANMVSCSPAPAPGVLHAIEQANPVCFPMGSFFSSILPHLLTTGVGRAVLESGAPKVFIPNSGKDNEIEEVSLLEQLGHIMRLLAKDAPDYKKPLIDFVLMDRKNGQYNIGDWAQLEKFLANKGIKLMHVPFVDPANSQRHLPGALLEALKYIAGLYVPRLSTAD